jgi:hypothetical protein
MSSSEDSYDYESYCVECYEEYDGPPLVIIIITLSSKVTWFLITFLDKKEISSDRCTRSKYSRRLQGTSRFS